MKRRNLTKRILVFALTVSLTLNSAIAPVFAAPTNNESTASNVETESYNEDLQASESMDSTGETLPTSDIDNEVTLLESDELTPEMIDGIEDELSNKSLDVIENESEDNLEKDTKEETEKAEETEEPEEEIDLENVFYRNLTADEINTKQELNNDITSFRKAKAGNDYQKDEIFIVCDSEDEALKIAEAYSEASGYIVKLKYFKYGVATFSIEEKTDSEDYSLNAVRDVMELAADESNNLPAVNYNAIYELYSIPDSDIVTKKENFSDPFLKSESDCYQWFHNMVNDKYVWEMEDYNSIIDDVAVAVIDTGIDTDNDDLEDAIVWSEGMWKDVDGNPQTSPIDMDGHGTNVAGIIGGTANEIGGRGVAAGTNIVSFRIGSEQRDNYGNMHYGVLYTDDIVRALNRTTDISEEYNIKAINMSLGGPFYQSVFYDAIQKCVEKGILVITAAGNESTNANRYPAAYNNTMSVAAINSDYEKSSFSNYGSKVDIAAPGGEIRYNSYTGEDYVESLYSTGSVEAGSLDGYSNMCGTSQATPVVSAIAAMIFAKYNLTADGVKNKLIETARPISSKYAIGAGCVDAAAAMGIDIDLGAPVVYEGDTELDFNETVSPYTEVRVEPYNPACVVYYTLNGRNPNPDDLEESGTLIYEEGSLISLGESGKKTLKVINTMYGNTSEVGIYNLTIDSSKIYNIDISSSTPFTEVGEDKYYEVAEGKKISLTANITPSNVKNKTIKWISSDSTIASISSKGQITAISQGTVTITATPADSSVTAEASVKVKVTPKASQVEIDSLYDPIELNVGESQDLSNAINVYPVEASQTVTYASS